MQSWRLSLNSSWPGYMTNWPAEQKWLPPVVPVVRRYFELAPQSTVNSSLVYKSEMYCLYNIICIHMVSSLLFRCWCLRLLTFWSHQCCVSTGANVLRRRLFNKRHLYLDSCYSIGLSHIGHRLFLSLSWMWINKLKPMMISKLKPMIVSSQGQTQDVRQYTVTGSPYLYYVHTGSSRHITVAILLPSFSRSFLGLSLICR